MRVTTRRKSDGSPVRYLQLAHNEWDPATKTSRPKVLYSFGREDALDRAVIERLVASLGRLLEPGAVLEAVKAAGLTVSDFWELDSAPGHFTINGESYYRRFWHRNLRVLRNTDARLFDVLRGR